MQLKLDKKFSEKVQARFEKYDFKVGILNDKDHKMAKPKSDGLKNLAGREARKISTISDGTTNAQLSKEMREILGFNYLTKPFEKRNSDIIKFADHFFKMVASAGNGLPSSSMMRRCENLLQAIVRNPITRGEYKNNTKATVWEKGFNWFMVDTGQLFKAIVAKAKVSRV